jgi:hypothetical protein
MQMASNIIAADKAIIMLLYIVAPPIGQLFELEEFL